MGVADGVNVETLERVMLTASTVANGVSVTTGGGRVGTPSRSRLKAIMPRQ